MHSLNAIMAYAHDLYRMLDELRLPESDLKEIQIELAKLITNALVRNGHTVVEDYTPRI